ncbi:MAG: hypothetical protein QM765_47095 [Myxococcales bacterium]
MRVRRLPPEQSLDDVVRPRHVAVLVEDGGDVGVAHQGLRADLALEALDDLAALQEGEVAEDVLELLDGHVQPQRRLAAAVDRAQGALAERVVLDVAQVNLLALGLVLGDFRRGRLGQVAGRRRRDLGDPRRGLLARGPAGVGAVHLGAAPTPALAAAAATEDRRRRRRRRHLDLGGLRGAQRLGLVLGGRGRRRWRRAGGGGHLVVDRGVREDLGLAGHHRLLGDARGEVLLHRLQEAVAAVAVDDLLALGRQLQARLAVHADEVVLAQEEEVGVEVDGHLVLERALDVGELVGARRTGVLPQRPEDVERFFGDLVPGQGFLRRGPVFIGGWKAPRVLSAVRGGKKAERF